MQTYLSGGNASASLAAATLGSFTTDADVFFNIEGQGGENNYHYAGIQMKHGSASFGFTVQSQDGVDTGNGSGNVFGLNILRHDESYGGGQSAMFINRLDKSIGINTDKPVASLHNKASSATDVGDGILLEHDSGNTGWNLAAINDAGNSLQIGYNAATTAARNSQSATAAVTVDDDGDVLIAGKLEVDGKILHIGAWKIYVSGNDLKFQYNGVDRLKLSTAGALIVENDITAFGDA